jgi:TPR repeat protein
VARIEFSSRETVEFAAQTGAADALFQLGLMYCAGRDVDPDMVTAHKWFNLAAMRGNIEARSYRAELAAAMSRTDLTRAQRLAREWLTKH